MAAAVQDLPGIGTWAGRCRLFINQPPQQQEQQQQRQQGGGAGGWRVQQTADTGGSFAVLRPASSPGGGGAQTHMPPPHDQQQQQQARGAASSSRQEQEGAWRWSFARKWASEQRTYCRAYRGLLRQAGACVSDDLEALAFSQACGVRPMLGMNLPAAPDTAAPTGSLAAAAPGSWQGAAAQLPPPSSPSHLSLCPFEEDGGSAGMAAASAGASPDTTVHSTRSAIAPLHPQSVHSSGTALAQPAATLRPGGSTGGQGAEDSPGPLPSATQAVLSMASQALYLLQRQGTIEAEVESRWEQALSAGGSWVGASLPGVRIDMSGKFEYSLLRVSDGVGHTRFLVRGHAGSSPASLLEAACREAAALSRAEGLPGVAVEIVGGGLMEWRQDTEREVVVQPRPLAGQAMPVAAAASPAKASYWGDMRGLTTSLVRQALPCHYHITAAGAATAVE
ncbi:hypothetical protein ABPG75_006090 [Micractinium tetrahymenae]